MIKVEGKIRSIKHDPYHTAKYANNNTMGVRLLIEIDKIRENAPAGKCVLEMLSYCVFCIHKEKQVKNNKEYELISSAILISPIYRHKKEITPDEINVILHSNITVFVKDLEKKINNSAQWSETPDRYKIYKAIKPYIVSADNE
jgi:hypothetical protein